MKAQSYYLKLETRPPLETSLMDSLDLPTSYTDRVSLNQKADSIPILLRQLGFVSARTLDREKINDSTLSLLVETGIRYRTLIIQHGGQIEARELSRSWTTTDTTLTVPLPKAEQLMNDISALLASQGDPFARVRLVDINPIREDALQARLSIDRGEARRIDSIVVKGYEKFPPSYIKHYAGIRLGNTFQQEELIRQNQNLDNLGFARAIKSPEALFEPEKTTVYLYLEKEQNNLFDGILGFNTEEDTGNLVLNGYLNLELNNNLNFGEQLRINYKADGRDQQNFLVSTRLPYLFRSPVGVELALRIFRRDSTFSTTDQQAKISYQFNPRSSAFVGYRGYESSNLLDDPAVIPEVDDYDARFFTSGVAFYDQQGSQLFPVKTSIELNTEIGQRSTSTEEESQWKLGVDVFHIFNLNQDNSIYLGNATRYLNSDTYLVNELFRLGGINSIRGFNENAIDASLYSVLNTEYRYRFNPGLYVHSIIDLGYVENQPQDLKEKLYSFGFGMGLMSKAGLLKIILANGNSEGQNVQFSNTKIHLSLTSRF
jgi:outer membrane protein assembly factor BamA